MQLVYENHGIGHRDSLLFIAGTWIFLLLNTFIFCPQYKVTDTIDTPQGQSIDSNNTVTNGNLKGPATYKAINTYQSIVFIAVVYFKETLTDKKPAYPFRELM